MRTVALFMLIASACLAQPTVGSISVDQLSHSSFRITWTATGCTQTNQRIKYGPTSAYSGADSGMIDGAGPGTTPSGTITQYGLSGLKPNFTYHFSPESSCDGVNWSTDVDTTVTTLALPSTHPALPTNPPAFTASFPNTAGYSSVTVANGCPLVSNNTSTQCPFGSTFTDLQVKVCAAVRLQPTNGTVINMPPGMVCAGELFFPSAINTGAGAAAIQTFTSANVSGNTITITGHGYSNGNQIIITSDTSGNFPTLTGGVYTGHPPTPLVNGEIYYIVSATANTFQLSLTLGGPAITLTDTGTATNMYVTIWPRNNSNAIVLQSSVADSAFTPPGVRTNPAWQPQMATLSNTGGVVTDTGNNAITFNQFTHDVYVRGIEMVPTNDSALANASNDPQPTNGLIQMMPDNSNITFDRNYIHGRPVPSRMYAWAQPIAGHNITLMNSYMENLHYPKSIVSSTAPATPTLGSSISSGVLTVAAGSLKLLKGTTCTTSGLTWTNTGGGATLNPGGFLEVDLDCTPRLILPAGMTASCTGNFSDGSTNHACTTTNTASGACNGTAEGCFTDDGTGQNARKCFALAMFPITAGVWGAVTDQRGTGFPSAGQRSVYDNEGAQMSYTGMGRGAVYIKNNYSSGAGLIWHLIDDQFRGGANTILANQAAPVARNSWVERNTLATPLMYMPGQAQSNGFGSGNRECLEFKQGQFILIKGNIFDGCSAEQSPYGCSTLWSANAGFTISDVEISYNTFLNAPCVSAFISVPHSGQKGSPLFRFYIHDNQTMNQNAYSFTSWNSYANHTGTWITHGYLVEDMVIDHNTTVDVRGSSPDMFHLIQTPQEGTQITNNIFWGNNDAGSHGWSLESTTTNLPSCTATTAKAGMDCQNTRGAGTTLYTYLQNVHVPQYDNSSALSNDSSVSGWQTAWTGLPGAIIQTGANAVARAAALQFYNYTNGGTTPNSQIPGTQNLRLSPILSPYCSGCATNATDGRALGADIDALEQAQGHVTNVRVQVTGSGTASVYWIDPDTTARRVDWGTTAGFTTPTGSSNSAGGARQQRADLTGLPNGTLVYFRVNSAVEQPTGSFVTR